MKRFFNCKNSYKGNSTLAKVLKIRPLKLAICIRPWIFSLETIGEIAGPEATGSCDYLPLLKL